MQGSEIKKPSKTIGRSKELKTKTIIFVKENYELLKGYKYAYLKDIWQTDEFKMMVVMAKASVGFSESASGTTILNYIKTALKNLHNYRE